MNIHPNVWKKLLWSNLSVFHLEEYPVWVTGGYFSFKKIGTTLFLIYVWTKSK